MPAAVEITIQGTPDPNTKAYHTRFELSEINQSGIRGSYDAEPDRANTAELGEFGKLILSMKGVVMVQIGTYVLLVTKAPLFEWSEVDPEIQSILKMFAVSLRQLNEVELPTAGSSDPVERHKSPGARVPGEGRAVNN